MRDLYRAHPVTAAFVRTAITLHRQGEALHYRVALHRQDPPAGAAVAPVTANFRTIGEVAADVISDMIFKSKSRQLHAKGERFNCEFIALRGFLEINDSVPETLGAYRMPPTPRSMVVDNDIEGGESADDDDAGRHVLDSDGSAD